MNYKICQKCNKKYAKPYNLSQKGWAKSKYCSAPCFRLAHGGWMRGKKFTIEHKEKIRLALLGKQRPNTLGEKHHNWKGGKPKCLECGKVLSLYNTRYCQPCFHKNVSVWNKGTSKIKERNCLGCNISFMPAGHNNKRIYCSVHCASRIPWNRGKPQPQTAREKNPNWKGGITPLRKLIRASFLYKEWRDAVFEKDNYTCQECGARSGKGKAIEICADHIKPFAVIFHENKIDSLEKAMNCMDFWLVENGQTLCRPCHRNTKTYGSGTAKLLKQIYV